MKLSEVYAVLDAVAPKALSDEYCQTYGAYDNSGILIDTGVEVEKILFTLDLTRGAVAEAMATGVNLIVTHHPVIYGGLSRLTQDTPMDRHLLACIQAGISVVSMHLNLDVATGGIDEQLSLAVKAAAEEAGKGKTPKKAVKLMHPLSTGGYGRAYSVCACTLHELSQLLQKHLSSSRAQVHGVKEEVKRVVSCCGAGADDASIDFAVREGADVLITADFKHHLIVAALEHGISVIAPTHYATENYGFNKYFEKISKVLEVPCVLHEDRQLL